MISAIPLLSLAAFGAGETSDFEFVSPFSTDIQLLRLVIPSEEAYAFTVVAIDIIPFDTARQRQNVDGVVKLLDGEVPAAMFIEISTMEFPFPLPMVKPMTEVVVRLRNNSDVVVDPFAIAWVVDVQE